MKAIRLLIPLLLVGASLLTGCSQAPVADEQAQKDIDKVKTEGVKPQEPLDP